MSSSTTLIPMTRYFIACTFIQTDWHVNISSSRARYQDTKKKIFFSLDYICLSISCCDHLQEIHFNLTQNSSFLSDAHTDDLFHCFIFRFSLMFFTISFSTPFFHLPSFYPYVNWTFGTVVRLFDVLKPAFFWERSKGLFHPLLGQTPCLDFTPYILFLLRITLMFYLFLFIFFFFTSSLSLLSIPETTQTSVPVAFVHSFFPVHPSLFILFSHLYSLILFLFFSFWSCLSLTYAGIRGHSEIGSCLQAMCSILFTIYFHFFHHRLLIFIYLFNYLFLF